MNIKDMITHIDHTNLKAFATKEDIYRLCDEAIEYHCASVCIPAAYVKSVKNKYGDNLRICTVIGFPLGYSTQAVKVFEAQDAIQNGADEIDMVINIGDVKNGEYDKVLNEITAVRKATDKHILKVIIETCYLNDEEKIKMCEVVTKAGADYIKTSTGFGSNGATIEDIRLFREHIGESVKIKAAGGIRTIEALTAYIEEGCDRIGSSSTASFI